jgi:hypothetical protein
MRVLIIGIGGQSFPPADGDQPAYHFTTIELSKKFDQWLEPSGELGYRAPLYFAFLSVIYMTLSDPPFWVGQLTSACLGAINAVLLYLLTHRIIGKESAVAGFWLRGMLPSFILADTLVMTEPLFACLLLFMLLTLSHQSDRPSFVQAAVAGLCTGAMILTREAATFYPLIFCGYLCVASPGWYRRITIGLIYAVAVILIISPWVWRNQLVWGSGLPLSHTAGVNLHIGNNSRAMGNWMELQGNEMPSGLAWGTPEFSRWHRDQAIEFIVNHPERFATLGLQKLAWLVWPRFLREEITQVYGWPTSITTLISAVCGFTSAALLLLSIIGLMCANRDWYWWITTILLAYSVATTFVVVGEPRYRDPMDHVLIPYAAFVLQNIKAISSNFFIPESNVRRKLAWAIPVILYVMCSWIWVAFNRGTV